MFDNDIIKALECCTRGRKGSEIPCMECPYNYCNIVGGTNERQTSGSCQYWLMKDSLDLINRLIGDIGAEAIKEYHEKVKQRLLDKSFYPAMVKCVLDEVEKEMVGDV